MSPRARLPRGHELVVREPVDNVYGRYKVLRRVDGRFVVHDVSGPPPWGPVFDGETDAREAAEAMSVAGAVQTSALHTQGAES